jgi:hypothetical protein
MVRSVFGEGGPVSIERYALDLSASDDSKYLAVPEWHLELGRKEVGRFQRLLVVGVKDKTSS